MCSKIRFGRKIDILLQLVLDVSAKCPNVQTFNRRKSVNPNEDIQLKPVLFSAIVSMETVILFVYFHGIRFADE